MEKNEPRGILSLIPEAIGKIKAVGKNHRNQLQNYQFRSIDDVVEEMSSILSELKLTIIPNYTVISSDIVNSDKGKSYKSVILKGDYVISAPDGSFLAASTIGEAYDYSDKACNKAMSTAFKYMLLQVFCIPTEEKKDTEFESIENSNKIVKPTSSVNPTVANFHKATGIPLPSKSSELKKELTELYPKKELPPEAITWIEKTLKENATDKQLTTAIERCKSYPNKSKLTPEIETEFNEAFGDNIEVDEEETEGLL
jgi:hypothetical protein